LSIFFEHLKDRTQPHRLHYPQGAPTCLNYRFPPFMLPLSQSPVTAFFFQNPFETFFIGQEVLSSTLFFFLSRAQSDGCSFSPPQKKTSDPIFSHAPPPCPSFLNTAAFPGLPFSHPSRVCDSVLEVSESPLLSFLATRANITIPSNLVFEF